MLSKLGFLINVLIACVGIGFFLMMLGASTLGGYLMFGGAAVAFLGLMLVH
jgi:hypothetical protein